MTARILDPLLLDLFEFDVTTGEDAEDAVEWTDFPPGRPGMPESSLKGPVCEGHVFRLLVEWEEERPATASPSSRRNTSPRPR